MAANIVSQMGAVQFIENMDRTTLTISDEEFEKNVEAAVSAIAEKHRLESPPTSATAEKPPQSMIGMGESSSTRPSMDNDATTRSSYTPRQSTSNDDNGEYDEKAAITGLLRTIQRPLSTIGRMFSDNDEPIAGSSSASGRSPAHTPLPDARPSAIQRVSSHQTRYTAEEAAARQASAEAAEAHRLHRAEHANVVETLAGMFPDLDRDIISDVVYQKEGRYVRPTISHLLYDLLTGSMSQCRPRRGCLSCTVCISVQGQREFGKLDLAQRDEERVEMIPASALAIFEDRLAQTP